MLLKNIREQIVHFGKKMINSRLTTGSGGNLSCFDPETKLIAISPSGVEYFDVKPEDIVIVNTNGEVIEGQCKPSSELNFHLILYKNRKDINAVVHTHSVFATTIACLNIEIPPVHYLVGFAGKKVPLAPYATFGSEQLAKNIWNAVGNDFNAALMANHGLVSIGSDLNSAFIVAEEIELVAQIYCQSKSIGSPVIIDNVEMENVIKKFSTYGKGQKNS